MAKWKNKHTIGGYTHIPHKPTSRGCYLYALACALCRVVFALDPSNGKDYEPPARLTDACAAAAAESVTSQAAAASASNTKASTSARAAKLPARTRHIDRMVDVAFDGDGGDRVVVADSAFSNLSTVSELHSRHLHGIFFVKNNVRGAPSVKAIGELVKSIPRGDCVYFKGHGDDGTEVVLAAQHDTYGPVVFLSTCGEMAPDFDIPKRHFDKSRNEWITLFQPKVLHNYHDNKGGVDQSNQVEAQ